MWKYPQMNMLFEKHSNQVKFPKKERTNHHCVSHSLRQFYTLVFTLCLKYISIFYSRGSRCYLHRITKVHSRCGSLTGCDLLEMNTLTCLRLLISQCLTLAL